MSSVVEGRRVCVTGAGGYVASWLVKFLLAKGYTVHGTVRDPADKKNDHLNKLENATEKLQLFSADLLDYDSIFSAISGCTGVFHVASPVPPKKEEVLEELFEPAVTGTLNVLNACSKANVKRVVVVSSVSAVFLNPLWPKGQPMDEYCWSDKDFCKSIKNYYALVKTVAEMEALEYAEKNGLHLVTFCPSFVVGPMLQSRLNATSSLILSLLTDGLDSVEEKQRPVVDVRDVAEGLLLVYENPEAKGRYICSSYSMGTDEMITCLKRMYPNYNYPKRLTNLGSYHLEIISNKLQNLGWKYRPLQESIADTVKDYLEKGLLNKL